MVIRNFLIQWNRRCSNHCRFGGAHAKRRIRACTVDRECMMVSRNHFMALFFFWGTLACDQKEQPAPVAGDNAQTQVQQGEALVVIEVGSGDEKMTSWVDAKVFLSKVTDGRTRGSQSQASGMSTEQHRSILDDLINDELLYQEALRLGLNERPEIKARIRDLLLSEQVSEQISRDNISEQEAQAYFEENRADFETEAQITKMGIITIRVQNGDEASAKATIDQIHEQLVEARNESETALSATFREIAQSKSQDRYARKGGITYRVKRDEQPFSREVMDHAFELPAGSFGSPIRGTSGWHIVWSQQKSDAKSMDYEARRHDVFTELKKQKRQELEAAFLAELRSKATVTINDDVLADLTQSNE